MQTHNQNKSTLLNNLVWMVASLGLAFIVWLIATTQADPIIIRSYSAIPVQLQPDAGLVLTGVNRRSVTVNVRARQSVMNLLTSEDITVRASLNGMGPGNHTVQLESAVSQSRQAIADTKPAQITITLEQEQSEQKPVDVKILNPPPVGYILGKISTSETQMLVTGVLSKVQQVVRLEAQLDLGQQRTTLSDDVDLVPVDINGDRVSDVIIAQSVRVTIEITQDEAVKQVFVTPNISRFSLPSAYVFLGIIDYNPKTISVTGSEDALEVLPDTLQTAPIDLSNVTGPTTFDVSVQLPEGIFLAEPGQTIEVNVDVDAREEIKQFDNIPVEIIGLTDASQVRITPSAVTVLVRGPQPIVQQLTTANIRVVVDVQGLVPGDYEQNPSVSINIGQIPAENISVLPGTIGLTITSDEATSTAGTAAPENRSATPELTPKD